MKLARCMAGFTGLVLLFILVLQAGATEAAVDPCRAEVGNVNNAAQQYRAAVRDVAQTCTTEGGNCTGAESQADAALQNLSNAHQTMLNACPTGQPPPPPPPPSPSIAGDLVITELMRVPSCPLGEWFEVYNPTSGPFELQGLVIDDGGIGTDTFTITQSVIIPAGGFAVFANAIHFDCLNIVGPYFPYTNFTLNNSGVDKINIRNGTVVIDSVEYDTAIFWPVLQGRSDNLDPDFFSAAANDSPVNWCWSVTLLSGTIVNETGTPWAPNDQCP